MGTQLDLAIVRSRAELVKQRTALVNFVRSLSKANGVVLPKCSAPAFPKRARVFLPKPLLDVVEPMLRALDAVIEQADALEQRLVKEVPERHPAATQLQVVEGIGPI